MTKADRPFLIRFEGNKEEFDNLVEYLNENFERTIDFNISDADYIRVGESKRKPGDWGYSNGGATYNEDVEVISATSCQSAIGLIEGEGTESKFREGDKVRFVGDSEDNCRSLRWESVLQKGEVATIDGVDDIKVPYYINGWYYDEDELELVESQDNKDMNDFQPFYVEVDGPQHSRMLQEIAFEKNFEWPIGGMEINNVNADILVFGTSDKSISWAKKHTDTDLGEKPQLKNPSLKEFRQALRGNYQWEDPITVGDHEVKFQDDYIAIGCEEYSHRRVETVYMAMEDLDRTHGFTAYLHNEDVGKIGFEKVQKIYNRIAD